LPGSPADADCDSAGTVGTPFGGKINGVTFEGLEQLRAATTDGEDLPVYGPRPPGSVKDSKKPLPCGRGSVRNLPALQDVTEPRPQGGGENLRLFDCAAFVMESPVGR
jgi:hypothetical protein